LALRLSKLKQREIARWLGFPDAQAWVNILSKIPAEAVNLEALLAVRNSAGNPGVEKLLCHLPRLNAGVMAIIADQTMLRLITPALLAEAAAAPEEESSPQIIHLMSDIINLCSLMGTGDAITQFRSIPDIRRRHRNAADEYARFLKQWKELQSEAERKLKTNPLNSASLQAMATSMIHSGDRIGAAEFLKKLIALPYLGQEEELFEAWNSMLLGRPDQDLLARLNRTNENNHDLTADYWYTLGTLQAYLGKPEEAQRSLSTALDHDDFTQLDARPWVLSGKILEQYGLKDSAQIAYRKARSISRTNEMADWALLLTSQEPSK